MPKKKSTALLCTIFCAEGRLIPIMHIEMAFGGRRHLQAYWKSLWPELQPCDRLATYPGCTSRPLTAGIGSSRPLWPMCRFFFFLAVSGYPVWMNVIESFHPIYACLCLLMHTWWYLFKIRIYHHNIWARCGNSASKCNYNLSINTPICTKPFTWLVLQSMFNKNMTTYMFVS